MILRVRTLEPTHQSIGIRMTLKMAIVVSVEKRSSSPRKRTPMSDTKRELTELDLLEMVGRILPDQYYKTPEELTMAMWDNYKREKRKLIELSWREPASERERE